MGRGRSWRVGRGRGVLAEGWVGLQVWEEKEIVTETRVMEAECRFHLSVSSVGFKKRHLGGGINWEIRIDIYTTIYIK